MTQAPTPWEDVVAALREMEPGYALLVCPSGQEQRVAERIGQELVLCPPEPLTALFPPRPVGRALSLYAGLPTNAELGLLNGRRDLLLRWGHRVVFVTDLSGLSRLQQHAGDIWAVVQINLLLPYVLERVPEGQAISHYADELRQRYGRLDLRGFARSENEDVSWDTVSVYVPITVLVESRFGRFFIGFTDILETATRDGYVKHGEVMSLLGHPGSGKTFALRWLALTQMEALRPEGAVRAPLGSGVVPILLPLPTLLEFLPTFGPLRACQEVLLRQGQPLASLLDSLAVQGRIAFLLDGLDEVGDEGTRARVADAVEQLAADYPRCRVVASSRITGFADAPVKGTRLIIQPLGEEEVHQFLVGWCERYAVDQYGPTGKARGHTEGERLAQDVLDHPQVAALARSPLMLTVLAMVHRAGLRLPDHRVELYEHVTRILVERWNRLRGPPGPDHGPPIPLADAMRLLGPVALDLISQGATSAIPEERLRTVLTRALSTLRHRQGLDVDSALRLFRNQLGLLVEQGPGRWGFLHLTLAEHLAGVELVRSRRLESIVADPQSAFNARFREAILLAAGLLGIVRAEDERLGELVKTILESAKKKGGRPSVVVPSLLAGLLADDPGLSESDARGLVGALIPTWWFGRDVGKGRMPELVREAAGALGPRILEGRQRTLLVDALSQHFCTKVDQVSVERLAAAGKTATSWVYSLLSSARIDPSPLLIALLEHGVEGSKAAIETWTGDGMWEGDSGYVDFPLAFAGRVLDQYRPTELTLTLRVTRLVPSGDGTSVSVRARRVARHLAFRKGTGEEGKLRLLVEASLSAGEVIQGGPISGRFRLPLLSPTE